MIEDNKKQKTILYHLRKKLLLKQKKQKQNELLPDVFLFLCIVILFVNMILTIQWLLHYHLYWHSVPNFLKNMIKKPKNFKKAEKKKKGIDIIP
jgi:hypothetical protein